MVEVVLRGKNTNLTLQIYKERTVRRTVYALHHQMTLVLRINDRTSARLVSLTGPGPSLRELYKSRFS